MKQIYMKKKIYMGLIVISIFLAIQSYRYCIWSEEYTYQLQEIDNGVYVQYHRVFSTVPADNYEVVQVCFNDTLHTLTGDVTIIYNNDVPQLSVTTNHFVNGDEIIVYVPKGSVLHYNDVGVR